MWSCDSSSTAAELTEHRPAGAALANTGAGSLWVIEPARGFEPARGEARAGADDVLDHMRVVRTLDEALAGLRDV